MRVFWSSVSSMPLKPKPPRPPRWSPPPRLPNPRRSARGVCWPSCPFAPVCAMASGAASARAASEPAASVLIFPNLFITNSCSLVYLVLVRGEESRLRLCAGLALSGELSPAPLQTPPAAEALQTLSEFLVAAPPVPVAQLVGVERRAARAGERAEDGALLAAGQAAEKGARRRPARHRHLIAVLLPERTVFAAVVVDAPRVVVTPLLRRASRVTTARGLRRRRQRRAREQHERHHGHHRDPHQLLHLLSSSLILP